MGKERWAIHAVPPAQRHLVTHESHPVRLTAVDEETVAEQLQAVGEYEAGGVTELVYQPAGPDVAEELARMMEAAGSSS
jgi:5,10-methylenetetrahydromethanopterin reductase